MDVVLAPLDGAVAMSAVAADATVGVPETLTWAELPARVRQLEGAGARWIWSDTREIYPRLLEASVRVDRCRDLRLCHAILAGSAYLPERLPSVGDPRWEPVDPVLVDAGEAG